MVKKNGDTFSLLLEQRVSTIESSVKRIYNKLDDFSNKMDTRMTELFNHQSTYVSPEVVTRMEIKNRIITIMTGIVCTLLGVMGTFIIASIFYGGS